MLAPEAADDSNTADGHISGCQARICNVCEGDGSINYEYNFRAMSKQCTRCDGKGLVGTKKVLNNRDDKDSEQSTRAGRTTRVMTNNQRYGAHSSVVV